MLARRPKLIANCIWLFDLRSYSVGGSGDVHRLAACVPICRTAK
jgi:hypothetical protein